VKDLVLMVTDIIFGDAPATGSDFFILTFKSLGVSEPADNSVLQVPR